MALMEARSYDVYNPPGTKESVVGHIGVVPDVGGCAIRSEILVPENLVKEQFIRSSIGPLSLPFFEKRVERAVSRAVTDAEYKVESIIGYPQNTDPFLA